MNPNIDLPTEMLLKVFELLGPQDLKTAVLVCRQWRDLGEDPRLWTWAVVRIDAMQDLQKVDIERLRMLQEIKVSHEDTSDCDDEVECIWLEESNVKELFKVISKIPTVTRISGLDECKGVSYVDPQLFVSVVNRLEKLYVWWFLNPEQLELLFSTMAENTNVKALEGLGEFQPYLSLINPVLFVVHVSMMDVSMPGMITSAQMEALCEAICIEDRPLRKLEVLAYSTRDIDPALLGLALNRLEEEESRLKKLMVDGLNAADVAELDADLVRRVEEKVGKFYFVGDKEDDDEEVGED